MAGPAPLDQGRSQRPAAGLGKGLREVRERGSRFTGLPRAVQFSREADSATMVTPGYTQGVTRRLHVHTGELCAFFRPGVVH